MSNHSTTVSRAKERLAEALKRKTAFLTPEQKAQVYSDLARHQERRREALTPEKGGPTC